MTINILVSLSRNVGFISDLSFDIKLESHFEFLLTLLYQSESMHETVEALANQTHLSGFAPGLALKQRQKQQGLIISDLNSTVSRYAISKKSISK